MLEKKEHAEYQLTEDGARMFIFEIHSNPKPQKQTMKGLNNFYDPSKHAKKAIQWQIAPHAPKEPLRGAVELQLTFYMPIPKDKKGIERQQMNNNVIKHYKRPDIDNLAYIVTNALKGIIYHDDSQICRMVLEKIYSDNPKTVIKVVEV